VNQTRDNQAMARGSKGCDESWVVCIDPEEQPKIATEGRQQRSKTCAGACPLGLCCRSGRAACTITFCSAQGDSFVSKLAACLAAQPDRGRAACPLVGPPAGP